MRYITGMHALNLSCELLTTGDWHTSALKWEDITFRNSEDSIFKDWGIEENHSIPNHPGKYNVANHIRALLDLIDEGRFTVAQGMREDFICNEDYTELVFDKVTELRGNSNWKEIEEFIKKEYRLDWIKYKEEHKLSTIEKKKEECRMEKRPLHGLIEEEGEINI